MKTKFQYSFLIALLLAFGNSCIAQLNPMSIQKVDSLLAIKKKPVLIVLTTDWCKYCFLQKKIMSKNATLNKQNNDFYCMEFNAESDKKVSFQGQIFYPKTNGTSKGIHEFATAITQDKPLGYPYWVLLDTNNQVVFEYMGVLQSDQFKSLIDKMHTLN